MLTAGLVRRSIYFFSDLLLGLVTFRYAAALELSIQTSSILFINAGETFTLPLFNGLTSLKVSYANRFRAVVYRYFPNFQPFV